MTHPFITVIGNIASGKSTMTHFLSQALGAYELKADELYKTNPFFQDAVKDRARWSFTSDIWFLTRRVEMLAILQAKLKNQAVVQDSGLPMSWVYANSRYSLKHTNEYEFQLYNEIYDTLTLTAPKEKLVIHLDFPTKILRQRLLARGRTFEVAHYTNKYLNHLALSLSNFLTILKKNGIPIIAINQSNIEHFLSDAKAAQRLVLENIEKYDKRSGKIKSR